MNDIWTMMWKESKDLLVFAPCSGSVCRSGCDFAGSFAGEFPTLTLDFELR
jgi:hypothetical protein